MRDNVDSQGDINWQDVTYQQAYATHNNYVWTSMSVSVSAHVRACTCEYLSNYTHIILSISRCFKDVSSKQGCHV